MYKILINVLYVNKLEFCASSWRSTKVIYYDARSTNHQGFQLWLGTIMISFLLQQIGRSKCRVFFWTEIFSATSLHDQRILLTLDDDVQHTSANTRHNVLSPKHRNTVHCCYNKYETFPAVCLISTKIHSLPLDKVHSQPHTAKISGWFTCCFENAEWDQKKKYT